jgi:mannose-1-phosphate guanylyltransferase
MIRRKSDKEQAMLYGVILAGGMGKRLWPESDAQTPKPLLSRRGNLSLLEETLQRLQPLIPPENILISTTTEFAKPIRTLIADNAVSVITEPVGRNTAPAIALAALRLVQYSHDAIMAIFPSDHYIGNSARLRQLIAVGAKLTEEDEKRLITIGIEPRGPATGYGYIKATSCFSGASSIVPNVEIVPRKAEFFCEKPDRKTAEKFLSDGGFYWNAGIFVWKAARILDLLAHFLPETSDFLAQGRREEPNILEKFRTAFPSLPSVSIDNAVLEKASDIILLPAPFDWSDLGTFEAFAASDDSGKDGSGNRVIGANLSAIEAAENIVRISETGGPFTVALGGVKNLLVVLKGKKLLIVPQGREDLIRRLADENEP